jgi:nucleotide-binding universal stress UspA family protein
MSTRPITVAVSGEERAALAYAAAEAGRTGARLRLVHVIDPLVIAGTPLGTMVSGEDFEQTAWQIVERAADVIRSITDEAVTVEKVVRRGAAAYALIEESKTSRLVVLEHRALSRLTRVFTGSTSTTVAARAQCPVVSVPESWQPDDDECVVVGVDESGEPEAALLAAFEEAAVRGAPVRVTHAWQLAGPYDRADVRGGLEPEWRERTHPAVAQAVERWTQKYPELPSSVDLRYEKPADALAGAGREASLLVLGRRTRRGPLRIGSLARTMIRVAECPVMVVPVPDLPAPDEDWSLDSDELSPEA